MNQEIPQVLPKESLHTHDRIDAKKEAMEEAKKEYAQKWAKAEAELLKHGMEKGRAMGAKMTYVTTLKECGISFSETLKRYANKFHVSVSEAQIAVGEYWY